MSRKKSMIKEESIGGKMKGFRALDSCPHCGKRIIGTFDHVHTVQTIAKGFYKPEEIEGNEENVPPKGSLAG